MKEAAVVDWLEARVTEIRERMTPGDEGSHWSLFFSHPDGVPVVASVVDRAMSQMDPELLHGIVEIIKRISAPACLIAVVRRDGIPSQKDRQLWRDLQCLMRGSDKRLLGFVVVGTKGHWRADDSDFDSAA